MMKIISFVSLVILVFYSFGCSKSKENSDLKSLEEQFIEIVRLANSKMCTDTDDWKFAAYGSKACGGPIGYIAYHKKVKKEILEKIEVYTESQDAYNKKWGVISDCAFVGPPDSVACIDGLPVLNY